MLSAAASPREVPRSRVAYDGARVEAHERRRIDDRFEVLETIGPGGTGVLYRALDRERGIEVALKTWRDVTPRGVQRLETVVRALRELRHPNLVELGELFEREGTWFLAMELVRGEPFLAWVRAERARGPRDGKTPAPRCDIGRLRTALVGLARGLAALHAAGVVHRDLEPSNILVDDHGRVVLLDIGGLDEPSQARSDTSLSGTAYTAPERARGEPVGPAADWYAVGVLLFRAIVGELPYGEASHDELLVLKQHVDVPPIGKLVDGLPPDLAILVDGLLARDPAKRPSEADILEALGIASDEQPAAPLPARDQLFVGRTDELARLEAALADSRSQTTAVIVEGESGIGKSALVARFVERARERDPRLPVLYGRCHEHVRGPFDALAGVLDDLTRFLLAQPHARVERLVPDEVGSLLAVFPALRAVKALADAAALAHPVATSELRTRAFAGLRDLLVRLCRRRATVIVIEDLQWADRDSCALLAELVRTDQEPLRVCLIATKRSGEGEAVVAHLGHTRSLALGGLDARAAEELVARISPEAATRATDAIASTRGNPMLLRELARHPETMQLDDAIWARASTLDAEARRVLAAVAVAGSPIPRHVAATVAGCTATAADSHVAALAREALVRVWGPRPVDAIETYHERVRAAVLAHHTPEEQRELHHALARVLESAGAPPAQLLFHFEAAGDAERVAHYLVAAAEEARAAFAFGRAAELFYRALDTPLAPHLRAWLLAQLAESLANDGRPAEAAQRFVEAAALEPAESELQLDLLRRAAERYLMAGRLAEGLATTRGVIERAGMTLPTSRAGTIGRLVWNQLRMGGRALQWRTPRVDARSLDADICWSIGVGLGMVDTLLGAYFSGRAARLALAHGNALQICRGMAAATIGASLLGRRERAARMLDCCERAAVEDGTPAAEWYVGLARTALSFILDNDFARTLRDAQALEYAWYAAGNAPSWETNLAMHFSLASQQMLGELRDLAGRVHSRIHDAKRKGDLFQEVTLRVRYAIRHLLDSRTDDARRDVQDALAAWSSDAYGNQRGWALWSLTRIAIYEGRFDDELDREWERWQRSLMGRVPLMQTEALHVYGTYLVGRALDARRRGRTSEHHALCRAAERIADKLERLPFPAAPGTAAMVRAAILWARGGDRAEAARLGLEATLDSGMLVYSAFFKRRLGEAIGGDEGQTLILQADELAFRAGWRHPERGAELAIPTGG